MDADSHDDAMDDDSYVSVSVSYPSDVYLLISIKLNVYQQLKHA